MGKHWRIYCKPSIRTAGHGWGHDNHYDLQEACIMKREHRTHERHSISIEAMLGTPDGQSLTLRLHNISFNGAFLKKIDAATPLPPLGAEVQVTIRYQSERGAEVETVAARVVRVLPDGLAVQFLGEAAAQSRTG